MFALLCGSAAVGFVLKSQLLEHYAQTGALESMSLIISFLVTITAIVLGLLINATKSFIDAKIGRAHVVKPAAARSGNPRGGRRLAVRV